MSKRTNTTKPARSKVSQFTQAKLITACIVFAQQTAAYSAAFTADPDGNSKNAEPLGEPYYRKATLALASVALCEATTTEAISAKAAVAEILASGIDDAGTRTDKLDVLFLAQFAKDTNKFARRITEEGWKAQPSPAAS